MLLTQREINLLLMNLTSRVSCLWLLKAFPGGSLAEWVYGSEVKPSRQKRNAGSRKIILLITY